MAADFSTVATVDRTAGAIPADTERRLLAELERGSRCVHLHGARGGRLALLLARLAHGTDRRGPLCVVTADDDSARDLGRDVAFFLGQLSDQPLELARPLVLPAPVTSPYAEVSVDRAALIQRMAALYRLAAGLHSQLVICPAAALRRKLVPPTLMRAASLHLRVGGEIDRDDLARALSESGYERYPVVDDPGTYAVRGGIVDLFVPAYRYPVRLELFGDTIESLRFFDPSSQRTLRRTEDLVVHPVCETLHVADIDPRQRLLALADELHHPTRQVKAVLDQIELDRHVLGMDTLLPAFLGELAPLWSYLDQTTTWVVIEPEAVAAACEQDHEQAEQLYAARLVAKRLTYAPDQFFVSPQQIDHHWSACQRIEVRLAERASEESALVVASADNAGLVAQLKRARSERGEEIIAVLARYLRDTLGEGRSVVVATVDAAHRDKLEQLLATHGVVTQRSASDSDLLLEPSATAPAVWLRTGDLGRGFRLDRGWTVIAHEEVFGPKQPRRAATRQTLGSRFGDLRELKLGDAVVHAEHGIGKYCGLVPLVVDDTRQDFLLLEYAGGDRLYLPVHRLSQVHRFIGGEAPRLDRLGGTTWQRKQAKVRGDVRRFGEELLQLYAQRAALSGHAYPEPGPEYADFEETFPFTETPDQNKAIEDTLRDLTAARPMDRLVCGDVGFGKTEVALRAAFHVASSGRQVALLAPTTVLVEQHQRRFDERLGSYGLRVAAISRFRPPAELRSTIEAVAAGRVDVVVGTHRLLSSDVRFADLGLLIIDEEQRFGVGHKERIKRLRTQVDVLALTATPIPRTLQLSMIGLREISVIATPPADRLAIRTIVLRHDDALIADAVRKELARGGQVFFVHNEVQTIAEQEKWIASLVPEARIAVAHGQMDSRTLERVMFNFVRGELDVLVCTTIIESGLDIPRANTMIVNRADRFGLSQLYQLRGRIGRSTQRAYCYLMVPPLRSMTGEARQRLELLQQFTQLGSGFSIASYDLELRGAGDLLGARQSGHIAAVGFETYARILEEAVAELRGQPIVRETDPDLNVHVPAYIPDDYVEDTGQRLELYKRLSEACHEEQAVGEIVAEIVDRYGAAPTEVELLGALMVLKGLAARLRGRGVDLSERRLTLTLDDTTPLRADRVRELVSATASRFRLVGPNRLSYALDDHEQRQPLHAAQGALRQLLACCA